MIKKDVRSFANGTKKTHIRVIEGYREKGSNKVKQKTVKTFGYLEDQVDQEAFLAEVEKFDREFKHNKRISFISNSRKLFYEAESNEAKNWGYKYLESIYKALGIDVFFDQIEYKGKHSLNDIFKLLTFQRILNPDSKRATYQSFSNLYNVNTSEFSLYEIYRSLTIFNKYKDELQSYIDKKITELVGRNMETIFLDTTNYDTTKDYNQADVLHEVMKKITNKEEIMKQGIIELEVDGEIKQFTVEPGLCKRGVAKSHSLDPIVQLGLLIDSNGLPIAMKTFPGNTSDNKTLPDMVSSIKKENDLNRVVVVADKGLNCSNNINLLVNQGDGYVFSQIVKGTKGRKYSNIIDNEQNFVVVNDDYKYCIFEEEYIGINSNGEKETRKQKVLIYYDGNCARREKRKRDETVNKAKNSIASKSYRLDHSFKKYIKSTYSVKDTGEIAEKEKVTIDYEKIKKEEKYDGYFCIITSELNYDEKKIREVYHGLWRIEESFRITKSSLISNPIFVRTNEHINGHFLICYVALVLIRMLQLQMDYSLSAERIIKALGMCSCYENEDDVIRVVKERTALQFGTKISKNGNKYIETKINDLNETIEDYKNIIKIFNNKTCFEYMRRDEFEEEINSIKMIINKK